MFLLVGFGFGGIIFSPYMNLDKPQDTPSIIPEIEVSQQGELPKIAVGQIWQYKSENPFEGEIRSCLVLEIKGEWVKYVDVKYKDKERILFAHSDTIRSFLMTYSTRQADNIPFPH